MEPSQSRHIMPVSFESGDIFATTELRGFAHGCNCAGAMGKGIAVAFKQRWPAMYENTAAAAKQAASLSVMCSCGSRAGMSCSTLEHSGVGRRGQR